MSENFSSSRIHKHHSELHNICWSSSSDAKPQGLKGSTISGWSKKHHCVHERTAWRALESRHRTDLLGDQADNPELYFIILEMKKWKHKLKNTYVCVCVDTHTDICIIYVKSKVQSWEYVVHSQLEKLCLPPYWLEKMLRAEGGYGCILGKQKVKMCWFFWTEECCFPKSHALCKSILSPTPELNSCHLNFGESKFLSKEICVATKIQAWRYLPLCLFIF